MIPLTDAAGVVEGPSDPDLRKLWDLAKTKFAAREQRQPTTRADARLVIAEYERLLAKPHGSVAKVIAERCIEAPGGD